MIGTKLFPGITGEGWVRVETRLTSYVSLLTVFTREVFGMYGHGQGMGFGFRGMTPPWPYIGRGRGGLPRCGYWAGAGFDPRWTGQGRWYPGWSGTVVEDKDQLHREADLLRSQLEQIEARIQDLENSK